MVNDVKQTTLMQASFVHALGSTVLPVLFSLIGISIFWRMCLHEPYRREQPGE